jgi:hypothetical protein
MSSNVLDAAFNLVHDYPGGATSLAPRLKRNATTLSHEVKATGTAKLGLVDAVKMSVLSNDRQILNAFAAECGCFVLPLPTVDMGMDAFHGLADAAQEFGKWVASVADAAADGRVTANELARVDQEVAELFARAQSVRATLATLHEASKPAHIRVAA